MFPTNIVEDIKTHVNSNVFFFKLYRLWDNVVKCRTVRQATDDDMLHADCVLDIWSYKRTLRICNTFFAFPRLQWLHECTSLLNLYVRLLSCFTLCTNLEIRRIPKIKNIFKGGIQRFLIGSLLHLLFLKCPRHMKIFPSPPKKNLSAFFHAVYYAVMNIILMKLMLFIYLLYCA